MPEFVLTEWDKCVIEALVDIEVPGAPTAESLRESIPHLVVTGRCECGCPSFFVRDTRRDVAAETGSFHYSNATTPDRKVGLFLLLRDDRPWSVDVMLPPDVAPDSPQARPDPELLVVTHPYAD